MKIIQNTPTHLCLQANLALYRCFDLLIGGSFVISTIAVASMPGQLSLQCQKTTIGTDCQVAIWNLPHSHSQTKAIQLQGVRTENHHNKKGTKLILETTQGDVIVPNFVGVDSVAVQDEINDFLAKPDRSNVDITLKQFVLAHYTICLFFLTKAGFKLLSLLRLPMVIKWDFVAESDPTDPSNNSGILQGTLHGIFWKKYIHYPFSELIKLNTEVVKTRYRKDRYRLNLQLRYTNDLAVSPEGLSESNWREVSSAIATIINIPAPELPLHWLDRLAAYLNK
jgi:hypothetical protein